MLLVCPINFGTCQNFDLGNMHDKRPASALDLAKTQAIKFPRKLAVPSQAFHVGVSSRTKLPIENCLSEVRSDQ